MTTTMQTPPTTAPAAAAPAAARSSFWKRFLIGLLLIAAIFLVTYALAWYNAYQLSLRFYQDAANSYKAGDYLQALVGYQNFDEKTNKYINYGGYLNVEKIWSNRYSWPQPGFVLDSYQRGQDIIQKNLTVEQAEQYILENTGRPGAPYFAEIYLRLGELYEQNGDTRDALDIYQSYASLFPSRKDLIERAEANLARLQNQTK